MTKQVALADATYAKLRAARHEGESFSDAIERLLRGNKDPRSFGKNLPPRRMSPEAHLRMIEQDRDSTTTDA